MEVTSPSALTPWENRDGRWYKREDYHRNAYGINGAKYRVCRYLMIKAYQAGYRHVVSAQSVLSPQSSICATLAEELGMRCTLVVGASKPETAARHENIAIALRAGAVLDTTCRVGYNGVIQPYGARLAAETEGWQLPYAISPPDDSSPEELQKFMMVGGAQVRNLPEDVETLVIPFGSGNTTAGIMYGLHCFGTKNLRRVVLVGIGPNRIEWLRDRLAVTGAVDAWNRLQIDHVSLHGWFADYGDLMPETVDGIDMHPRYEGKVVRFLNGGRFEYERPQDFWDRRDDRTGFWIVAGPMG